MEPRKARRQARRHLIYFLRAGVHTVCPVLHTDFGLWKERKKENTQPKGGMGGRHTATTQGFFKERSVWCYSGLRALRKRTI